MSENKKLAVDETFNLAVKNYQENKFVGFMVVSKIYRSVFVENNYFTITIKVPNRLTANVVRLKKAICRFVSFRSSNFTLLSNILISTTLGLSVFKIWVFFFLFFFLFNNISLCKKDLCIERLIINFSLWQLKL